MWYVPCSYKYGTRVQITYIVISHALLTQYTANYTLSVCTLLRRYFHATHIYPHNACTYYILYTLCFPNAAIALPIWHPALPTPPLATKQSHIGREVFLIEGAYDPYLWGVEILEHIICTSVNYIYQWYHINPHKYYIYTYISYTPCTCINTYRVHI